MPILYVGVGEYSASNASGDILKTMALGSCVAVVALFPKNRSVGLLHVALPDSVISPQRAKEKPGMFADTGIPLLLCEMKKLGWVEGKNLVIKLAGGANIMDPNNTFDIGKRNLLAIRKVLWAYNLGAMAEDVGDVISRTLSVEVDTGNVKLSSPGRGEWLL